MYCLYHQNHHQEISAAFCTCVLHLSICTSLWTMIYQTSCLIHEPTTKPSEVCQHTRYVVLKANTDWNCQFMNTFQKGNKESRILTASVKTACVMDKALNGCHRLEPERSCCWPVVVHSLHIDFIPASLAICPRFASLPVIPRISILLVAT